MGERAHRQYPKLLQWERWCRNRDVPQAEFLSRAKRYANHVTAYRRKTIFTVGGDLGSSSSIGATISGTVNYWRSRFISGNAATQLRFKLDIPPPHYQAESPPTDPRIDVSVTLAGGATTTKSITQAAWNGGGPHNDAPQYWRTHRLRFDISANATYEILVAGVNGGRPVCVTAYEFADPDADEEGVPFYIERGVSAETPIYDALAQLFLLGLSDTWRRNRAHLLSFAGRGDGTARSVTGTTWTNLIDGSSTSVGSATPGYRFGDATDGSLELADLLPLVRLKDGTGLPVTFCAYANTSAGSTGEVRLQGSGGTACSLTGITTSLQWHTVDTTLVGVDTLDQLDLQLRNGTALQTTNVYAVAMYCRP
jgi:hypothetical protein